jgi:hypothetical protein
MTSTVEIIRRPVPFICVLLMVEILVACGKVCDDGWWVYYSNIMLYISFFLGHF